MPIEPSEEIARIAELEAENGKLRERCRKTELEAALAALLAYETETTHLFLSGDIRRARAALSDPSGE